MDKIGLISENKNRIGSFAVDGLLYGLVSGVVMFLSLAAFALLSGDSSGVLLERFSTGGPTSPVQGLLSHLPISAIYGVLFGALIWPLLRRVSGIGYVGCLGGLVYGLFLFLLAQTAILPGSDSPLLQLPFWQWAAAHGIYGSTLGILLARKSL